MSVSHSLSMHLISRSCEFCLKEIKTANQPQKGNILQFKHSRTCTAALHFSFHTCTEVHSKVSQAQLGGSWLTFRIVLPNAIRGYTQGNCFNLTLALQPQLPPVPGKYHLPLLPSMNLDSSNSLLCEEQPLE